MSIAETRGPCAAIAGASDIDTFGSEPIPTYPYYSPEYFEQEVAAIFRHTWLQIAHVCELPECGSFIVRPVEVAKTSILITRGPDDVIRAFHNVCVHRGARLVSETSGAQQSFSCQYHMWTYGYDGRLRAAPDFERFRLNKADCGLRPVAVEVCAGMIFINLDASPRESLREFLGEMAPRLETLPVARAVTFSEYVYEIEGNWKLVVDNFQENYHLRFVHARTGGGTLPENPFGYPTGFSFMGPHRIQTIARGGGAAPKAVQQVAFPKLGAFAAKDGNLSSPYQQDYHVIFPNLFAFGSGISPFTHLIMPRSASRSRAVYRFYWTTPDDSASRRFAREFITMSMRDLHAEDQRAIEDSQIGLSSGVLQYIHFQSQEVLCRHFYNEVNSRVEAYKASLRHA